MDMNTMKVVELKALARERGLKGYSRLRKAELINMLDTKPIPTPREMNEASSLAKPKPAPRDAIPAPGDAKPVPAPRNAKPVPAPRDMKPMPAPSNANPVPVPVDTKLVPTPRGTKQVPQSKIEGVISSYVKPALKQVKKAFDWSKSKVVDMTSFINKNLDELIGWAQNPSKAKEKPSLSNYVKEVTQWTRTVNQPSRKSTEWILKNIQD